MESTLPAIAFAVLMIAQFAAVVVVQNHAELFPPLLPGRNHLTPGQTYFNDVPSGEINHV